jgi:archaellum component FlaG (FlaF/FlaG flagellin family)
MASRRSAVVALIASVGSAALLVVVLYSYGDMLYGSPDTSAENIHATNTFHDHNLQITVDYAENKNDGNKQSFVLTVKNIGQNDLLLSNVDLAGSRCEVQPTCNGQISVMDYRMVGIDSALSMNPVYDQELRLSPGDSASSSINGSWPQAESFAAVASYSLNTGSPWLDEYTFGMHSRLTYKNSSIESPKDSAVADEPLAGVLIQYWRQYDGMPEPMVYAFKSLSLNNTDIALHEVEKTAKNSIDPRSAVRAIKYDTNATINIGYMATALSFPLSREVAAPTQTAGEASYIFALVPEKLTPEQLSLLSSRISAYDFELIGYADNYSLVVDQDENMQVFLKHHVVVDNVSSTDNGGSSDYVEIYIKNTGTKPIIIEGANVYAKNIFDGGASSSKFIYSFIGNGDSFVKSEHQKPIRLEPIQQTVGTATGNWSDWQYFEAEVRYTLDGQVRAINRVISDVERNSSDNNN